MLFGECCSESVFSAVLFTCGLVWSIFFVVLFTFGVVLFSFCVVLFSFCVPETRREEESERERYRHRATAGHHSSRLGGCDESGSQRQDERKRAREREGERATALFVKSWAPMAREQRVAFSASACTAWQHAFPMFVSTRWLLVPGPQLLS